MPSRASTPTPTPATLKQNAQRGDAAGLDIELPWGLNYGQLDEPRRDGERVSTDADQRPSARRILEQKFRFKADTEIRRAVGLRLADHHSYSRGPDHLQWQPHRARREGGASRAWCCSRTTNRHAADQADGTKLAIVGATVPYGPTNGAPTQTRQSSTSRSTSPTGDLGSSRVYHHPAKGVGRLPFCERPAASPTRPRPPTTSRRLHGGRTVTTPPPAAPTLAGRDSRATPTSSSWSPAYRRGRGRGVHAAGDRASLALDAQADGAVPDDPERPDRRAGGDRQADGGRARGRQRHRPCPGWRSVPAVVMAWYPGQRGGAALGKLLWRQARTSAASCPSPGASAPGLSGSSNGRRHDDPMDYFLGYQPFDNKASTPLFPFGHGLSYTTFEYTNLQLGCSDDDQGGGVAGRRQRHEHGHRGGRRGRDGLRRRFPDTTARRPAKELKGFQRVQPRRRRGEADHHSGPPVGPRLLQGRGLREPDGQVGRRERPDQGHGRRQLRQPPALQDRQRQRLLGRICPGTPTDNERLSNRIACAHLL